MEEQFMTSHRFGRRGLVATAIALAVVGGSFGSALAQDKTTLNMISMAQAGMTPDEMNAVIAEFQEANPDVEIAPEYVAYDALHDKIATGMASGSAPFDIMLVDDIWFPEFAEAGWLLDVSADIPPEMLADSSQAAWDIVTYDGKQFGLPWLLDQLYFYYNSDMLAKAGFDAPPTTWEELLTQAQAMKDQGIVEYPIVLPWGQIEASITQFVALLYGNGGQFFDEAGNPVFNSPEAVETLQWMVDAVASGLVNPASTTYGEEDARNAISAGKAAFTINWAYMYDLANNPDESTVPGQIAMAMMPVSQKGKDAGIVSSSNNGSMGFAVAAGSENAQAALDFVTYLTSKDVQKRYAAHVTPLWTSLASDPELLAAQPVLLDMFAKQWPFAHVRPKVPYYLEMSQNLQVAIQEALIGAKSAQEALDEAVATAVELGAE
jgi:multiple sugar transport system substrate-binding protein